MRSIEHRTWTGDGFHYWGFITGEDGRIEGFWGPPGLSITWKDLLKLTDDYTGLKDSTKWEQLTDAEREAWLDPGGTEQSWNGREIYEGDIIRYTPSKGRTKSGSPYIDMTVEWYQPKAKFVMRLPGNNGSMYQPIETALKPNHRVIGNIRENPELLNGNNS